MKLKPIEWIGLFGACCVAIPVLLQVTSIVSADMSRKGGVTYNDPPVTSGTPLCVRGYVYLKQTDGSLLPATDNGHIATHC